MKIALNKRANLEVDYSYCPPPRPAPGCRRLEVIYCAICRTDAKCWHQGHRDLAMPRVLGHEIAGRDPKTGKLYTVWPAQACGECAYCRAGRENLCDEIKIIGFHSDGGFASFVDVPISSLIEVSKEIPARLLCFAEPAACIYNALETATLRPGEKLVIYGGGVVGLLAGIISLDLGAKPTIVELDQKKIARTETYRRQTDIPVVQELQSSDFHVALNACDSPMAFSHCLLKLRKGGRFAYFSGLKKNEEIDTNLMNLIHYHELHAVGSYGPRREHFHQALPFLENQQNNLALLIEEIITPLQVAGVMASVLAGKSYKYIIDCRQTRTAEEANIPRIQQPAPAVNNDLPPLLSRLIQAIKPVDEDMRAAAQAKIDCKTKPLGALGRLEELAVQLSLIQQDLMPAVPGKSLIVFAGDHGVVEEGVSAFPARVTVEMVKNFLAGGAAINIFCHQFGINLAVADIGVNGDFADHPMLYQAKIARGTNNFTLERAMSMEKTVEAIGAGAKIFHAMQRKHPCQILGLGEMGIGNTSSATAIISAVTGLAVADVCGRGTGVDDKGLERKIEVLARALALHRPDPENGLELLSKLGGYELAGIAGATLAATGQGVCVVLDGIISTAAGLIAYLLAPRIQGYLVSGHKSVEIGQQAALKWMNLKPVIDLDMRLGEGTGAAFTMNAIDLACTIMRKMASFDEAGVSNQGAVQKQAG